MKKANTNIPADEMLLAEAIAAAHANKLRWTSGSPFTEAYGLACSVYPGKRDTKACCAIGAIAVAKGIRKGQDAYTVFDTTVRDQLKLRTGDVYYGNDNEGYTKCTNDNGMTLGRAFRYAMTDEG